MRMRIDMQLPPAIVAYVGGAVHALDPLTGKSIWHKKLPKAYKTSIGTVLIDGDIVLAGVGGRVYCLELASGRLLWTNEMPGLGLGMVAVATPATSANGTAQAAQQAAANAQAAAVASEAAASS